MAFEKWQRLKPSKGWKGWKEDQSELEWKLKAFEKLQRLKPG